MDWRDLRTALAVGQHQRLSDAARALGMDATTVSRRVSALESELDVVLFRRTPRRWTPTAAGEALLARCESMASEVRHLRHDLDHARGHVTGRVRMTAVDAVLAAWIVPALPALRDAHPSLALELFATNELVDLQRGQADVALRLGRPKVAGLVARKIADIELVLAAHERLMELPRADRPIVLVGFFDSPGPENTHLRALGGRLVFAATSLTVSNALVQTGQAVGVLPRPMAEAAGLHIVNRSIPPRPLWRAVPEALVDAPRIRAVTDWLDALFA